MRPIIALLALLTLPFLALPLVSVPGVAASKIVAIVNNEPITQNEVARRAAFLKLRRVKGNRTAQARDELIDEAIQMQQAKRRRVTPAEKDVDAAFSRFASGNRMKPAQLRKILSRAGVGERHFKDYIRAQMAWQRVVPAIYRESASKSAACRDFTSCLSAGSNEERTTEVILQQVIFTKSAGSEKNRKAQAQRLRRQMTSCDRTRALAAKLNGVAVRDLGKMSYGQLPPKWSKELRKLDQGGVSQPRVTEKGTELITICRKREVASMGEVTLDADLFSKEAPKLAKDYLDELKKKAKIVRR